MRDDAEFPDFAVSLGEEGSDPLVRFEGEIVRVDEYARSGHLDRLDDDLADVAALGVDVWRYGMPWRRTEPAPGEYDWTLWDRALAACDRHGLVPVIDLCHFGLPDHLPGFADPTWVEAFLRYVDAFLARYPGPRWFTPVNEPMITAVQSALFGLWNDHLASRSDFGRALANVTLANLEAIARIAADRDGWWIGAEGLTVPVVRDPLRQGAADETEALGRLVWDLHFGLDPDPSTADVLVDVPDATLARLRELTPDRARTVVGHDLYPVSVMAFGGDAELTVGERVAAYLAYAREWHARYGVPFWVAETSNLGLPATQQELWLEVLVGGLGVLRDEGLPVRGVCWYSRGDQFDWDSALTRPVGEVTEVGVFDQARRPRPVADTIRALAATHR